MRLLSFLLAIITLILALQPGMDLLSVQEESSAVSCCDDKGCTPFAKDINLSDQEEKEDCHGNTCNICQFCGTCVLFYLSAPDINFNKKLIPSKQLFRYLPALNTAFPSDFWNPPKVV